MEGAVAAATKSEDLAKKETNTTAREEYIRLNEAIIASQK
jgi:hypothetical protein